MAPLTAIMDCFLIVLTVTTATASTSFDPYLRIFNGIYYTGNEVLTIHFNHFNRCYSLDCDSLNNKAASVRFSGLPTTGVDGKAYIAFYPDSSCNETQIRFRLPHNGGVRDFEPHTEIEGKISSFMVLSESTEKVNGDGYVCTWTGADVLGGTVYEDDTQNLVVNPA